MVSATKLRPAPARAGHAPKPHAPWFAGEGEGTTLHRYLDDQFVQRFVQEAQSGRLQATREQGWYQSDRVGRFKDYPLLRLPMHRAFYIACCEVSCDTFGQPAYDPARVRSAGLVVRRGLPGAQAERWRLHEGEANGWQTAGSDLAEAEPDEYRRYLQRGLLQPRFPEPPYSGEETYPMHALLTHSRESETRTRSRTLLWGYLPLGGSYRVRGEVPIPATTEAELAQELTWPFGTRDARAWRREDSRPVLYGYARHAFHELIGVLLRYRVTDAGNPDNEALRTLLSQISFYGAPLAHPPQPYDRYGEPNWNERGHDLLTWLTGSEAAILDWHAAIAAGRASPATSPLPFQATSGGIPFTTPIVIDLYLSEEQATLLRQLITARGRRAMARNEDGLAVPRFAQGEDDIFHVVPFVRWHDECGCERIAWGAPSLPFRVSSPLDPDFQRPQAIILPRLDDLKRGAARGVALLAPKSLADKLLKISPEMPPAEGGPGNRCGLCWMISLSIPVVTICAMIILMILINLLNLFLGWLPWAILALPRLCGKLLKE